MNKQYLADYFSLKQVAVAIVLRLLDFFQTSNISENMFQDPHYGANLELELKSQNNKIIPKQFYDDHFIEETSSFLIL